MGQELGERASSSLGMQRLQSRASSFDEQLWDELEAQARRRRSNEGGYPRGPASRNTPQNAASPFARQLERQGAPTLFGQPSRPILPMPQRPRALGDAASATVPEAMASPFSAAAHSMGSLAAQQGLLLAQATDAPVDAVQGPLYPGIQQSSRNVALVREHKTSATAGSMMQPSQDKHGSSTEMALDTPMNKDRPLTDGHNNSLGASAALLVGGGTGPAPQQPSEEPMGIHELAVLSKRPSRRSVPPHRLAEVMAALDAKGSSRPSSSSSTAPSDQDRSRLAPEGNAGCAGFPTAASEGAGGSQITLSRLMGVGPVSQSVPELAREASGSGTFCASFR